MKTNIPLYGETSHNVKPTPVKQLMPSCCFPLAQIISVLTKGWHTGKCETDDLEQHLQPVFSQQIVIYKAGAQFEFALFLLVCSGILITHSWEMTLSVCT